MIRLAVVDDQRLVALSFARCLDDIEDFHVVGTARTVREFFERTGPVDVVLLDLRLADGSEPSDNVRTLVKAGFRVLIVSGVVDHDEIRATVAAGAEGYVTKNAEPHELERAVREVAAGGTAFSRDLAFAWVTDRLPARPKLSEQERSAVSHYASGMTLAQVAGRMAVSEATVGTYLRRVKEKYRAVGRPAQTKLELARRVAEDGLQP
ncbi:response regulator transcription factor [Frankia sp. AgB1.9]|uniref:response regulator transcription factor n=1 Tax=unclassified Frankia TaxID=2632575 RepID=UPI0019347EC9|nr:MULTISPECIES: response regulator transcription factor [unclassified Frankia]MBL7487173.1 response regulator transcription factor [Frankia sp. AgW1.1]MBL7547918.1 response regulator transcription factor [Frankia sp. AgB1.9]MBL7623957.1 response regulator transcription factor [Frankia sp. AgB1.8]